MPISDKTRKVLWGRSGNRCAICKRELVINATTLDDESVIGDECHIASRQANGPRHAVSIPEDKIDSYNNLILLCHVHHKMVDDQHETYTTDILKRMKWNHETWVSEKLSPKPKPIRIRRVKKNIPPYLPRIRTGREALDIIEHTYASSLDHDELESEVETDLVAEFFQEIRDWGDMGLDAEPSDRVHQSYRLTQIINQLESFGLYVFGAQEIQILEGGVAESSNWPISIVHIARKGGQKIVSTHLGKSETDGGN